MILDYFKDIVYYKVLIQILNIFHITFKKIIRQPLDKKPHNIFDLVMLQKRFF